VQSRKRVVVGQVVPLLNRPGRVLFQREVLGQRRVPLCRRPSKQVLRSARQEQSVLGAMWLSRVAATSMLLHSVLARITPIRRGLDQCANVGGIDIQRPLAQFVTRRPRAIQAIRGRLARHRQIVRIEVRRRIALV
jgi:hypothetical protein